MQSRRERTGVEWVVDLGREPGMQKFVVIVEKVPAAYQDAFWV